MTSGKADENMKVPTLSNMMDDVFQWGAIYEQWFSFPSWEHGKMHSNLLALWWHYLPNSGQWIVSNE